MNPGVVTILVGAAVAGSAVLYAWLNRNREVGPAIMPAVLFFGLGVWAIVVGFGLVIARWLTP